MENLALQIQLLNNTVQAQNNPMDARLDAIQKQMNVFGNQLNNVEQILLGTLGTQFLTPEQRNVILRKINKSLEGNTPLQQLANGEGHIPPNFPGSKSLALSLTEVQLDGLLAFYDLPLEGDETAKLQRFLQFIGLF